MNGMRDPGLDTLLCLDGSIIEVGGGYWVKIEARQVPLEEARPHGLSYSLTLHDADGERLLGYDNSHSLTIGSGPAARRTSTHDHLHPPGNVSGKPYPYKSAGDLMVDFWADVDRFLSDKGVQ